MNISAQGLRGLRLAAAFSLLAAILACGGGDADDSPPPVPSVAPVVAPSPTSPTAPTAPTAPAAATSLVNLTSGFLPDPHTATGTAGGSLMANTMDPSCRGNVPAVPQHTLMLGSDFSNLRILVNSAGDPTLVIRGPDGVYRCNDDHNGLQPEVSGQFPQGTYQIWVGVFAGMGEPYTIGFTELSSVTTSSLPLP